MRRYRMKNWLGAIAVLLSTAAYASSPTIANNNSAMASLSVSANPVVTRLGFATPGDSPAVTYVATSSACSLNSGAGDGGAQVPGSGGCYVIAPRENYDVSIWGVNPQQADNGPYMDKVWSWAANASAGSSSVIAADTGGGSTGTGTSGSSGIGSGGGVPGYGGSGTGGVHLTMQAGGFYFNSTFDCHAANGVSLDGQGDSTVWFRDQDYGDTMTCTNAENIHVGHVWAEHFIGANPVSSFSNGTGAWTGSTHGNTAHFHFVNVNNFEFDHVTAWNMNYNFEIVNGSFGRWVRPKTVGYYDGTHNQTVASFLFDGADGQSGTGSIHPTLMTIDDPILGSYGSTGSVTLTSGSQSRTLSGYSLNYGPLDHILVNSMEGLYIGSGGNASGAYQSSLHLAPRGVTGKPILNVTADAFYFDSVGESSVLIENGGQTNCGASWVWASNVHVSSGDFNNEIVGNHAVEVPVTWTPPGGTQWTTTCPAVAGLYINNMNSVASVKSPYSLGAVRGGFISGGGARNYNVWGVYSNDVSNSSAVWLYGLTTDFHVANFAAGGGNDFNPIQGAPGAPYSYTNQSMYGVSIAAGLVNVTRDNIQNDGYYTDYAGAKPSASCNSGAVTATVALSSDGRHGRITTPSSSGNVTSCTVAFNGAYSSTANIIAHVTDGQNQYGEPVASAVQPSSTGATGFGVVFGPTAADGSGAGAGIGNGGSFLFSVDSSN